MSKKIFSYVAAFTAILIWNSCDKVEFPKQAGATGPTGNPNAVVKKVLIEDYTGTSCGNCPPAAVLALGLESQYGGKLIGLTIHAGALAFPAAPPLDYDFQTTVGTDYFNTFAVQSWPTGLINRINFTSGGMLRGSGTWAGDVSSIINDPPDADIQITNSYDAPNRNLSVSVKSKFLTAQTNPVFYKLVVLFVEDSVHKPQKDDNLSPPTDLNYNHHHILRAAINGNGTGWGDTLVNNVPINVGDSVIKNCTPSGPFHIPAQYNTGSNQWNVDDTKCSVIAFIYDANPASPTYYQIIQVEEKKVR